MKKNFLIFTIIFISILSSSISAQFTRESLELGLTGSLGPITNKANYGGGFESKETYKFLQLSSTIDYYLADGFSIEPEVGFLLMEDEEPAFHLLGNLSYTFKLPGQKFAPYIRGGYGVSNSFPFLFNNSALIKISEELDVEIINAGAGLKILLSRTAVIRTELNYRTYDYSEEAGFQKYETSYSAFSLMFGISVIID